MSDESSERESDVEPTTALTGAKVVATVADDSRKLLQRVLGPAADAVGTFLAEWIQIKKRNALRIAERADARRVKLQELEEKPVSMRVAMRIFDEAAYCGDDDSEIVAEYLGGVLASARSVGTGNDLANSYASLISRMAADHLRVHYILYRCIHLVHHGEIINIYDEGENERNKCFVPVNNILMACARGGELYNQDIDLYAAMFWLNKEGLLGYYEGGPQLPSKYEKLDKLPNGLVVAASALGAELFLWGLGQPNKTAEFFLLDPEGFAVDGLAIDMTDVIALP